MENKVRLLSEETIDKIAAGEVVENPASVVKELVENAVDAGASLISIEILGGGFQSIIVRDDGLGMSSEDALLSLKRHATSKIKEADYLFTLRTMGFRGEALASIAAISKFKLTTAQQGMGVSISGEGSNVLSVEPSARPRGTTVEVRELFYNVPARKKFQKSAAQSSAEITRVVTLLALAHSDVGFELVQQRKRIFYVVPMHLQERCGHLLGEHFRALTPLYFQESGCEISGLIGDPRQTRYNRTGQYLFINQRPVHCLPLLFAMRDGYGTRIDVDRHPIYVVHLSIAPSAVDVNVHPQKLHVRLKEEELIKKNVRSAVNLALQGAVNPVLQGGEVSDFPSFAVSVPQYVARESSEDSFSFQGTPEHVMSKERSLFSMQEETRTLGLYAHYLLVNAKHAPFGPREEGVIWVDLLAAEARVLYEKLLCEKTRSSQRLLIPKTFSCSKAEASLLLAGVDELQELGFQLREVGPTVFMIEAIPSCMEEKEIERFLHETIASGAIASGAIASGAIASGASLKECARALCRARRSSDKAFTHHEAEMLLAELMKIEDFHYCPHGKATFHFVKKDEIENYFTRKN